MMRTADVLLPAAAPPPAIRTECIADADGFTSLGPQWNELLRASASNRPFLTWEWLHAWWRHCAAGAGLRLLCVHDGDQIIAAAPFMETRTSIGWPSRLAFLGTGYAGSDYLDVVVRSGREDDALSAIEGFLTTTALSLRLDHVPEASLSARLVDRLSTRGWTASITAGGICPTIALAGHTWDSYLATLGPAHRANVRRRLRNLERAFQVRFDEVRSPSDGRDALQVLVGFHNRRFEARGGSTAFCTRELRAFHDEATGHALEGGWLRMYVLRLDGVPAAVMYGFLYDRRFYFYQHGFDDRYRDHSIGLALMALTIRAAIHEGADAFDLLWGDEPYKARWARDAARLQQIHLFPPHVGGRIQRGAVTARRTLARLARGVLFPGDTRAA